MKSNIIFSGLVVAVILVVGIVVGLHTAPAVGSKKPLYYTCPMHPSVRAEQPGSCPICGMNLEPVYATAASTNSAAADATPLSTQHP